MAANELLQKAGPSSTAEDKRDTPRDKKGLPKTGKRGHALSAYVLRVFQESPDRAFVIRDLVDRTGGKPETVKRILARLSSTGKGAGPIRRISHGMYQYAPEKEHENLQELARSGRWKIENLTFVSLGAQGGVVSLSETAPEQAKGTLSDSSQSSPHPNVPYPWTLPTGQLITWEDYQNGTQVIRISADGNPPISPDTVLLILSSLKNFGLDDTWQCVSMELNLDRRTLRIDASYSLQVIEGLLVKAYQHGDSTRLEVADRRKVSMREVTELFFALARGIDGKEVIAKVREMEGRVTRCEKSARLALSVATSVRDRQPCSAGRGRKQAKKDSAPVFRTGADIHKEGVPVRGRAGGKIS